MQNTMVRGGGAEMASRGKMKLGIRGKKRGKKKRRKITLKKGEKTLEMHVFGPAAN